MYRTVCCNQWIIAICDGIHMYNIISIEGLNKVFNEYWLVISFTERNGTDRKYVVQYTEWKYKM